MLRNKKIIMIVLYIIAILIFSILIIGYVNRDDNKDIDSATENDFSSTSEQNTIYEGSDITTEDSKNDNPRTENGLPDYSKLDPEDFPTSANNTKRETLAEEFKGNLKQTGLVSQGIYSYDGIFIEQNTDEECENIAIASFQNTSKKMISYAVVTVETKGITWTFEMSTIPPGATVLVQEKNKAQFSNNKVVCQDVKIAYEENISKLEDKIVVRENERGGLEIENISGNDIPVLRLFYKIKEQETYVGGITYTVKLENIPAGSTQTVYPSHYLPGYSEVLLVREYDQ